MKLVRALRRFPHRMRISQRTGARISCKAVEVAPAPDGKVDMGVFDQALTSARSVWSATPQRLSP